MRYLSIGDLKTALEDLFDNKRGLLEQSVTGRLYGPLLDARRTEIAALPEELTGGLPMAKDLASVDARHDGLGAAIWHLCRAHEDNPLSGDMQRGAAQRVREAIVPGLGDLERTYAQQAAQAAERRALVPELAADFAQLSTGSGNIGEWVNAFLDAAGELEDLLNQREQYKNVDPETRNAAGRLRAATLDVLERARLALADELKLNNAGLDDGYEAQLFGHFDELDKLRSPDA